MLRRFGPFFSDVTCVVSSDYRVDQGTVNTPTRHNPLTPNPPCSITCMAPKKPGRPTLLDDDKMERICSALRAGCYIEDAAGAAGITGATYYNWMSRGRTERERRQAGLPADPHETTFLEFLESVERAQAEAAVAHLQNIAAHAADGSWQASAWILERKFPRKWGRFDRTEHTGPEGGPVRIDVSTEDLERKVQRILESRDTA